MNWAGPAIVLSARAHGEGAAIAQVLSREHGRYAGLVHGRRGKGAALQPGALVEAKWRARLAEHLGVLTLELQTARTGAALEDRFTLAGLSAACAVAESALPERDPHPAVYDGLDLMLSHLGDRALWPALYVRWEMGLLAELGFGVAAAGTRAPRFMSPPSLWEGEGGGIAKNSVHGAIPHPRIKSGAGSNPPPEGEGARRREFPELTVRDGAREFPIPRFLSGGGLGNGPSWVDIVEGLALTGHFLGARLYAAHNAGLPDARVRLADEAARLAKAEASA